MREDVELGDWHASHCSTRSRVLQWAGGPDASESDRTRGPVTVPPLCGSPHERMFGRRPPRVVQKDNFETSLEAENMANATQKVVQYLDEAHASETGLVRVLQSQIAMTPRGTYRTALETPPARDAQPRRAARDAARGARPRRQPAPGRHRRRRERRRAGAGDRQDPVRPPARLRRRGEGAQERQGRRRDRGPRDRHLHGDRAARATPSATTRPRASPRRSASDEEQHARPRARGDPEAHGGRGRRRRRAERHVRHHEDAARPTRPARPGGRPASAPRRPSAATTRQARKVPGAARAEGTAKGAVAREPDLPIARYDALTAEEIIAPAARALPGRPREVEAYERKGENRTTVTGRIAHAARATSRGRATTS